MSTTPTIIDFQQFEIVRHVTKPIFKLPEDGSPAYIKFLSAIEPDKSSFSERMRKSRKEGENQEQQKPVDMADIVNLQTGEECRIIVHSVLKSQMNEAYPENAYVTKMFKVTKSAKKQGRGTSQYFTFDIAEIRLKQQPVPVTEPVPAPVVNATPAKQVARK